MVRYLSRNGRRRYRNGQKAKRQSRIAATTGVSCFRCGDIRAAVKACCLFLLFELALECLFGLIDRERRRRLARREILERGQHVEDPAIALEQ